MTKVFQASELEELVRPADIRDILDSLRENGLLTWYSWDYETGEIEVEVSKDTEIQEMMLGFQDIPDKGVKRKGTRR